eukprot:gene18734-23953_t
MLERQWAAECAELQGKTPDETPAFNLDRRCSGAPIPGVEMDVWHSSPVGFYENQDPDQ